MAKSRSAILRRIPESVQNAHAVPASFGVLLVVRARVRAPTIGVPYRYRAERFRDGTRPQRAIPLNSGCSPIHVSSAAAAMPIQTRRSHFLEYDSATEVTGPNRVTHQHEIGTDVGFLRSANTDWGVRVS